MKQSMKQKKMNNKGFSLVELIIVIAIMAVLVGILAPQYLKYVENSRISADKTSVDQVASAVKVALTDEKVATEVADETAGVTITFGDASATADPTTLTEFNAALKETIDIANIKMKSKKYKAAEPTITAKEDASTGELTVTVDIED